MMKYALDAAFNSSDDVPVGAVIVKDGKIVATSSNEREKNNDVTSHAEILAIRQAQRLFGNWRLDGCQMYVTLEPCPMCAWAILQSRISVVYFGSYDKQYGAFGSAIDLRKFSATKTQVYGGIMEEVCDKILEDFFKGLR